MTDGERRTTPSSEDKSSPAKAKTDWLQHVWQFSLVPVVLILLYQCGAFEDVKDEVHANALGIAVLKTDMKHTKESVDEIKDTVEGVAAKVDEIASGGTRKARKPVTRQSPVIKPIPVGTQDR